jgi:hypothetical protein
MDQAMIEEIIRVSGECVNDFDQIEKPNCYLGDNIISLQIEGKNYLYQQEESEWHNK